MKKLSFGGMMLLACALTISSCEEVGGTTDDTNDDFIEGDNNSSLDEGGASGSVGNIKSITCERVYADNDGLEEVIYISYDSQNRVVEWQNVCTQGSSVAVTSYAPTTRSAEPSRGFTKPSIFAELSAVVGTRSSSGDSSVSSTSIYKEIYGCRFSYSDNKIFVTYFEEEYLNDELDEEWEVDFTYTLSGGVITKAEWINEDGYAEVDFEDGTWIGVTAIDEGVDTYSYNANSEITTYAWSETCTAKEYDYYRIWYGKQEYTWSEGNLSTIIRYSNNDEKDGGYEISDTDTNYQITYTDYPNDYSIDLTYVLSLQNAYYGEYTFVHQPSLYGKACDNLVSKLISTYDGTSSECREYKYNFSDDDQLTSVDFYFGSDGDITSSTPGTHYYTYYIEYFE